VHRSTLTAVEQGVSAPDMLFAPSREPTLRAARRDVRTSNDFGDAENGDFSLLSGWNREGTGRKKLFGPFSANLLEIFSFIISILNAILPVIR
jgi:hypothetical protein